MCGNSADFHLSAERRFEGKNCTFAVAMEKDQCFYIGYISKTRGLKGEVQLFFTFEDYINLNLEVLFLEIDNRLVPYFTESVTLHKNSTAYMTLDDVDHIDKAQAIVRKKVYLTLDNMPQRDPEDFTYKDLVGFIAIDESEGELGEITVVQEMPQQFIATVPMEDAEVMFPLNEDLIVGIDPEEKIVVLRLPDGLIDAYLD